MGYMQLRHGPNQLGGRWGLLQTVADVLKLLLKEDMIPKAGGSPIIYFGTDYCLCTILYGIAVIPFTDKFQFADIGVGLLYYIAISGITTLEL